jgi:hypothetical protein
MTDPELEGDDPVVDDAEDDDEVVDADAEPTEGTDDANLEGAE